jgi:hypothetical protein
MPTTRLLPTQDPALADKVAPAGLWTIQLEMENAGLRQDELIEAWIERDDLLYGYPRRGRQSYFEKSCYHRFDELGRELTDPPLLPFCEVQRRSMISGIAAGQSPVVVGGMLRKELRVASYSAGGPVFTPEGAPSRASERKPDLLLVSEDSKVHAGVFAAGARSGSVVAMSGTSVAAPQLARWVADRLGNRILSNRAAAIAEAEVEELGLPPPVLPPPPDGPADTRSGWGRAPKISTRNGVGRRYWWP